MLSSPRFTQSFGIAAITALCVIPMASQIETERGVRSSTVDLVGEFCRDCHDPTSESGGVVLDAAAFDDVGAHAELLERVVRKLRARTMPPPENPRPSEASYQRATAYLETALDESAAAAPNPGVLPQLHRLTRTEYRNTIRDLLSLENLPAELDYELLLPADNSSSGFDNIAELLFVSPAIMERYLETARKISRVAVGDPDLPVMVNIHRMPLHLPQDDAVAGLPLGTRGGLATDSYFPLDAEYSFRVQLERPAREQHELEITIDGARVAAATIGLATPPSPPQRVFEFRVPVDAGPHRVGATFVERTAALDERTLRPQRRSRGTLPAMEIVTISGPYSATGPGDTPSRDRLFVCRPQSAAEQAPCAREILGYAGAPRLSAARRCSRRRGALAVLRSRPRGTRLRARHPARARARAGEPAVPVPHRASSGWRRARNDVRDRRSWSWRRASRFSCGAACRTTSCSTSPLRASSRSRACCRGRSHACSRTRAPMRWSVISRRNGCSCATWPAATRIRSCSATTTKACAAFSRPRRSCSSRASSAANAACSIC